MRIFEKYSTTGFSSYEEFAEKFETIVPENFNFGFDVVDVLAREQPNKRALLWTNDNDEAVSYTHLDVYKRQPILSTCCNPLLRRRNAYLSCWTRKNKSRRTRN